MASERDMINLNVNVVHVNVRSVGVRSDVNETGVDVRRVKLRCANVSEHMCRARCER